MISIVCYATQVSIFSCGLTPQLFSSVLQYTKVHYHTFSRVHNFGLITMFVKLIVDAGSQTYFAITRFRNTAA